MLKTRICWLPAALVLLAGVAVQGQGPADDSKKPPPQYHPASVERGRSTFTSTCGFCHGSNAKGGEKGPDLLRSVLVLDDEGGKMIAPVIVRGRPEKGMPRFALTTPQIADIADFLHDSIEKAKDRDNYKILNIVTGDAKAGEAYFVGRGGCKVCHSVTGDLKGVASKYDPVTLQGKFLQPSYTWTEGTPPQKVSAVSVTVTLQDGKSYTGTPVALDDFNVALRDASGVYRSFKRTSDLRVDIHNRLQAHLDLVAQYSDTDIHNLTAYLVTLK